MLAHMVAGVVDVIDSRLPRSGSGAARVSGSDGATGQPVGIALGFQSHRGLVGAVGRRD